MTDAWWNDDFRSEMSHPHREDPAMTETKTRVRRTPAERAQAELETANARYAKAEKNRDRLKAELDAAQRELEVADKYARYAASHPDLSKKDVTEPGD